MHSELLHWLHEGDELVSLLRRYSDLGCVDSDLQLICVFGSGVSHLPHDIIPTEPLWSSGQVNLLANQAQ